MVTRKPLGPPLSVSNTSSTPQASHLPYPTTPPGESAKTTQSATSVYSPDLHTSPAFDLIDMSEAQKRQPKEDDDDEVRSRDSWEDSDDEDEYTRTPENDAAKVADEDLRPKPLKFSPSQERMSVTGESGKGKEKQTELPLILRPGPANGATTTSKATPSYTAYNQEASGNPWESETSTQQNLSQSSYNPWTGGGFQAISERTTGQGLKNRASMWWQDASEQQSQSAPPPPIAAPPPPPSSSTPVELPSVQTPRGELSKMPFDSPGDRASWETAEVLEVPNKGQAPLPPVVEHDAEQGRQSNPWSGSVSQSAQSQPLPGPPPGPPPQQQYSPPPGPPPSLPNASGILQELQASKAPRPSPINPPPHSLTDHDSVPETPGSQARRQKNEHYSIKHINWQESSTSPGQQRQSPILTQNVNGPCPLLALVNALVLSTPADQNTALVETLRTREQISLGLLLDAVFDELISGRGDELAQGLPDVSELYAFLLALHTGMNVNPRFVTPASTPRGSLDGHPPEVAGMHPAYRAQNKAGCFEETKEMRLYSTFGIPLMHGWLPSSDTAEYQAMQRCAQTFEDAQNVQFAELELNDKLHVSGLNGHEQQLLQDVQLIKRFLNQWPTQLTEHGLDIISRSLQPGQIAILFRNDHFSTVYKEPRHGALMTLVTDAGYASHDEVVWESLVDVNGAASEMFSGDFRVVSHQQDARLNQGSTGGGVEGEGWQTVQSRSRYHGQRHARPASPEGHPPPLPGPRPTAPRQSASATVAQNATPGESNEEQRRAAEQEDHDLALALQLQEEEEDAQRQAEERRRREHELSQQFLERESLSGERPPAIPPRRANRSSGNIPVSVRPPVTRQQDDSGQPPPPTYEQAASDRPYRESGSTAVPQQGNPLNAYDALRAQQSAYAQQSSVTVNTLPPGHQRRQSNTNRVRRRSSQPGGIGAYPAGPSSSRPPYVSQAAGVKDTEEKCIIM